MIQLPGSTIYVQFENRNNGTPQAPDTAPTIYIYHNGVDATADWTLTLITDPNPALVDGNGNPFCFIVSGAIPTATTGLVNGAYLPGDTIQVRAATETSGNWDTAIVGAIEVGPLTNAPVTLALDQPNYAPATAANAIAILSAIGAISAPVGHGGSAYTITVTTPTGGTIPNVRVWVTSDPAGEHVIAGTLTTGDNGQVQFMLPTGTAYVWRELAGYTFTNPQPITVS